MPQPEFDWRVPRITLEEIGTMAREDLEDHPAIQSARKGALPFILDALDLPRNLIAQGIAGALGVDTGEFEPDALFGKKVWTSDILDHMGWEEGWGRSIAGFIGDVAIDPLTYFGGAKVLKSLAGWTPKIGKAGEELIQRAAREMAETGATTTMLRSAGAETANWARVKGTMIKAEARAAAAANPEQASKALYGQIYRDLRDRLPWMVTQEGEAGDAARAFFKEYGEYGTGLLHVPFTDIELRKVITNREGLIKEAFQSGDRHSIQAVAEYMAGSWRGMGDWRDKIGAVFRNSFAGAASPVEILGRRAIAKINPESRMLAEDLIPDMAETTRVLGEKYQMDRDTINQVLTAYIERENNLRDAGFYKRLERAKEYHTLKTLVPDLAELPDELLQSVDPHQIIIDLMDKGKASIPSAMPGGAATEVVPMLTPELLVNLNDFQRKLEKLRTVQVPAWEKQYGADTALELLEKHTELAKDERFASAAEKLTGQLAKISKIDMGEGVVDHVLAQGYVPRIATAEAADRFEWVAKKGQKGRSGYYPGTAMDIGASQDRSTRMLWWIDGNGDLQKAYNPSADKTQELVERYGAQETVSSTADFNKLARQGIMKDLLGPEWSGDVFMEDPWVSTTLRKKQSEQGHATRDFFHQLIELFGRYVGTSDFRHERKLANDFGYAMRVRIADGLANRGLIGPDEAASLHRGGQKRLSKVLDQLMAMDPAKVSEALDEAATFTYGDSVAGRFADGRSIEGSGKSVIDDLMRQELTQRGVVPDELWKKFAARDITWDQVVAGTDPAKIAEATKAVHEHLNNLAKGRGSVYGREVLEGAGKKVDQLVPPDGWRIPEMWKGDPHYARIALPDAIADNVEEMMERLERPETTSSILKAYDKTLGLWKTITLTHPSWPIFNFFGGVTFNALNGVGPTAYNRGGWLWRVMQNSANPQALEKLAGFETKGGAVYTAQEIKDLMRNFGVIDNSFVEALSALGSDPLGRQWLERKLKDFPAELRGKAARALQIVPTHRKVLSYPLGGATGQGGYRAYFRVNEGFDNWNKGIAFLDRLFEGDAPEAAAAFVHKIQPDYHASRYSHLEHNTMMRLFPFYKWMKGATYSMLTQVLMQRPWGLAAMPKLQQMLEQENAIPRDLLPDWFRDELGVQVSGGKSGGVGLLLGNMTPHADVFNLFDPLRSFESSLTPLIRAPLEAHVGRNFFTGAPIRKYPGENLAAAIARENLRPLKEYDRILKVAEEQTPLAYKIPRMVIGGRVQWLSPERIRSSHAIQTAQRMEELRRALNSRQIREENPEQMPRLAREYMDLLHLRNRLGLTVPKQAQQTLQDWEVEGLIPRAETYIEGLDYASGQ